MPNYGLLPVLAAHKKVDLQPYMSIPKSDV